MTEALRIDNPYSLGELLTLSDGGVELVSNNIAIPTSNLDRYYVTAKQDTLSNLAYEAYGNSKLWWVIYLANDLTSPFEIELQPGTELRIPDIESLLVS